MCMRSARSLSHLAAVPSMRRMIPCWICDEQRARRISSDRHHRFEVASIEKIERVLFEVTERSLEATVGIVRGFGVRRIAREHEQISAAVADDSADVLARERRELHRAPDVLRWLQRHRLQVGIRTTEALVAEIQFSQELRRPAGARLDD